MIDIKRLAALMLCALLLFCCACTPREPEPLSGASILYHLEQEPLTLDPQIASDSSAILVVLALYEGLARLDENGSPYPGVAESWKSNSDFTEFTFTLRDDAQWSDGTPLTAEDFVFAFRRALDPATGSDTCNSMFCIKNARQVRSGLAPAQELGAYAADSRTLVVELEYPYEAFPALTATAPFMPCREDFFLETDGKYGLEYQFILGNGPFAMGGRSSWEHDQRIRLYRSSTYRGEQQPVPSGLEFYIGDEADISDPILALGEGTVDALPLPEELVAKAQDSGFSLTSLQDTTWGISFNTQDSIMQNEKLRNALILSLDRQKLTAHLPELSIQADRILGGASAEQIPQQSLPMKDGSASGLFAEAMSELELEKLPVVTVLYPDDANARLMVNEMLIVWNGLTGSYFNMLPLDEEELERRVASGNYQIALCGAAWGSSPLSGFASDSSGSVLNDPVLDSLLLNAEQAGSGSTGYYAQAEAYLLDQAIFYPLYYKSSYYACAPEVSGVIFLQEPFVDFIRAYKADT